MEEQRGLISLTFPMKLGSNGANLLRKAVAEKLSHLSQLPMDVDQLTEYVVVHVCGGRRQDQVMKDLQQFLGDHTTEFVAWIWDYIMNNIDADYERQSVAAVMEEFRRRHPNTVVSDPRKYSK